VAAQSYIGEADRRQFGGKEQRLVAGPLTQIRPTKMRMRWYFEKMSILTLLVPTPHTQPPHRPLKKKTVQLLGFGGAPATRDL
jgi:hypothetical protein